MKHAIFVDAFYIVSDLLVLDYLIYSQLHFPAYFCMGVFRTFFFPLKSFIQSVELFFFSFHVLQLSELVNVEGYSDWIRLVAAFTSKSLQSWQVSLAFSASLCSVGTISVTY